MSNNTNTTTAGTEARHEEGGSSSGGEAKEASSTSPPKRTLTREQALQSLAQYGTCEISDALVKLDVKNGGYIPDLEIFSPFDKTQLKLAGEAYTVKMVDAFDEKTPKVEDHFVDAATPGSVMVVAAPPHCKNAVWGGLMSAGALAKRVQGVIIDGRCRDLGEHRRMGFPVIARGHSTLGQNSFTRVGGLNEAVTIIPHPPPLDAYNNPFPSVTVHPRDFVVADEDGVVVVNPEQAEEVLKLVSHSREVDERCMQDILAGRPVAETFKKYRGK